MNISKGKHAKPIMKYVLMEEERKEGLNTLNKGLDLSLILEVIELTINQILKFKVV